jgi:hypothetical protein
VYLPYLPDSRMLYTVCVYQWQVLCSYKSQA